MIRNWNEKDNLQKTFSVIGILLSITVMVFAILEITDVYENDLYMLFLGLLMLSQSVVFIKKSKRNFILYVVVGLFIIVSYILKIMK